MSLSLYSEPILEDDGLLSVDKVEMDEKLSLLLMLSSDLSKAGPCIAQSLKIHNSPQHLHIISLGPLLYENNFFFTYTTSLTC